MTCRLEIFSIAAIHFHAHSVAVIEPRVLRFFCLAGSKAALAAEDLKKLYFSSRPDAAGRRYVSISAGAVRVDQVECLVFGEQLYIGTTST
jgi:hypothetical protein